MLSLVPRRSKDRPWSRLSARFIAYVHQSALSKAFMHDIQPYSMRYMISGAKIIEFDELKTYLFGRNGGPWMYSSIGSKWYTFFFAPVCAFLRPFSTFLRSFCAKAWSPKYRFGTQKYRMIIELCLASMPESSPNQAC